MSLALLFEELENESTATRVVSDPTFGGAKGTGQAA
ncbi:hypothetical protein SAMN05444166_3392 [Singulisphaera sp. GP187]|nr:hypothetical protein SAMN05444166_3392 [Singulisphaera sp. GP187]